MNKLLLSLALVLGALTGAGCSSTNDGPEAQLFGQMGAHTREVTTSSVEAQTYFDQGLAWMYSFNHDEAIRSFGKAAEIDPECAMAWWAIALCEGPNYNDPKMTDERNAAAWEALQEARRQRHHAGKLERALIRALTVRYQDPAPEDRTELEQAYADAMAEVWAEYPDDSDVGTLYAEAMMVQRPWKLYSADKQAEGDTPLIRATLERVMAMDPGNPGANHLYIHAVEPSAMPEQALAAADRLRDLVPDSGHINHMPSHIYVQVGQWGKSVDSNLAAMGADERYRALSPDQGIQHMYMVHNAHMLAYSAMMAGREAEAMSAARAMWSNVPPDVMEQVAPYIDLWMTSVYDVQKRFGRWDDILAEAAPPAYMPMTTAVWHAHRAVAYAAKKDFEGANREYEAFHVAWKEIPEETVFSDEPVYRILEVSELFIAGEIELQKGEWERAAEVLEEAVAVETSLDYGEPPQWLQPTRHTLGAVYLQAGKFEEAERVYREDLDQWRNNGWSLFGLSHALEGQGKTEEAADVMEEYEAAWAQADAPATTSCLCIPAT